MQALVDSLVSGTVELVFRLCATYGLLGTYKGKVANHARNAPLCVSCEEIDRSPLANSMPIRVTGRCTDCWSSNGFGTYCLSSN